MRAYTARPDALLRHTRRVRCTPDPCAESSANSQGHRTRATGRTLSVRCSLDSCAERVAKPPTHWTLSTRLTPVRPVHSAHLRHRLTPHWTLWTSVRCCEHQRPVSARDFSKNSHRRNRKYILNFLKSARTHTPLNLRNSTSFAKCANTTKCTPPCASVLAFSQTFSQRS